MNTAGRLQCVSSVRAAQDQQLLRFALMMGCQLVGLRAHCSSNSLNLMWVAGKGEVHMSEPSVPVY
jgi:hypothetical protein